MVGGAREEGLRARKPHRLTSKKAAVFVVLGFVIRRLAPLSIERRTHGPPRSTGSGVTRAL